MYSCFPVENLCFRHCLIIQKNSKEELENYAEKVCVYIARVEKMELEVDTSEVIQSAEEDIGNK